MRCILILACLFLYYIQLSTSRGIMRINLRSNFARPIYIVDGLRTPWLKVDNQLGTFSAADLAVQTSRYLLARQALAPEQLDEVVTGCVMPSSSEMHISRLIALRLGCEKSVSAYTIQRNCASGMQALDSAALDIACGRYDLVLSGGTEAMSRAPLLFKPEMTALLTQWKAAKSFTARLHILSQFRLSYLTPRMDLLSGLSYPHVNSSVGHSAEIIAHRFTITRQQMDAWSLQSHTRLAVAHDTGVFKNEINTIYDRENHYYSHDNGVRRENNLKKLSTLKPFFNKSFGLVTAGNSSQMADGAAFLILASKKAVKRHRLPILARILDITWAAVNSKQMSLAPVHAVALLLKKQRLSVNAINFWEINETFAGQVLACLAAWKDSIYCKTELGLSQALGQLDPATINIHGGAIAMGHPIGASGARIVLHLANILKRKQARLGIATLCSGDGQSGAILLENVDST